MFSKARSYHSAHHWHEKHQPDRKNSYPKQGQRVAFAVDDAICPWVGGTFEVVNVDGLLSVMRMDGGAPIRMTIEGVAALAYGTLAVEEQVEWSCGYSGSSSEPQRYKKSAKICAICGL